mmetsp:Transcript_111196/g.175672  ORF Transcript_111196/g.175672 Transcript_111196/m.175672 type:complete len:96 (-) Transcript_111196:670-957(-)
MVTGASVAGVKGGGAVGGKEPGPVLDASTTPSEPKAVPPWCRCPSHGGGAQSPMPIGGCNVDGATTGGNATGGDAKELVNGSTTAIELEVAAEGS